MQLPISSIQYLNDLLSKIAHMNFHRMNTRVNFFDRIMEREERVGSDLKAITKKATDQDTRHVLMIA